MMYIYAALLGLVFGVCGLGPGGLFVTLGVIWLSRALRKYEKMADNWVAYQSAEERAIEQAYRDLQRDAAVVERRSRTRNANVIDVSFREVT